MLFREEHEDLEVLPFEVDISSGHPKAWVSQMMSFEEIEHTADRAFRVTGRDLADLLENAARAMQALEGLQPTEEPSATRDIEVEGVDRESLLVNWLNEILFLEQTHQLVCERFLNL